MLMFVIFCWLISGLLTGVSGFIAVVTYDRWITPEDSRADVLVQLFGAYATLCGIMFIWASVLLFLQIRAVL